VPEMNVVSQTFSHWFTHDDGPRARLHAAARRLAAVASRLRPSGLPPAPMSATRSVHDSPLSRGSAPGVSPAPSLTFPTAAGWVPVLPPELRTPPPSRLTASGVYRPIADQRQTSQDRRLQERRVRDDGSPYGVERRSGATRVGERRTDAPADPSQSDVRLPSPGDADYDPHHSQLLARFHGR
jgi:hypothetical protein